MNATAALSATVSLLLVPAIVGPTGAALTSTSSQSPAAAYGVADHRLVLDTPVPKVIFEDASTHLSGRLTSGRAGQLIVLRSQIGGRWKPVDSTRTGGHGEYAFDVHPDHPQTLVLQTRHPRKAGPLTSQTQQVQVLNRWVNLRTSASYSTFTSIVLSGVTRPAQPGRHIIIQHQRDGRWISGANGYTDASGNYAIPMRNNWPGVWTVRAYWPGSDPAHGTAEYSPAHRYTVRAVLHAVVTAVTREELGQSYHAGCPVGPSALRNVTLTFKTFGLYVDRGTLVVRDSIVDEVKEVWGLALQRRFPIRKIFPTAHYGGSDVASMYHDNTSAFNCRHVTGDPTKLSPHSYGVAIDVDPVENPYQDVHGVWWPRTIGQRYRDRSHPHPGMLFAHSAVTEAMLDRGFQWGGSWSHPDYQHFDPFDDKRSVGGVSGAVASGLGGLTTPAAALLGPGWRAAAVRARHGAEAARGVLPLGCSPAGRRSQPGLAPRAAQTTYRSRAGDGLAQLVVLQFRTAGDAAAYFARLQDRLARCTTADGSAGERTVPGRVTPASYAGLRVLPGGEVWSECDVRVRNRVAVLLASKPSAARPSG